MGDCPSSPRHPPFFGVKLVLVVLCLMKHIEKSFCMSSRCPRCRCVEAGAAVCVGVAGHREVGAWLLLLMFPPPPSPLEHARTRCGYDHPAGHVIPEIAHVCMGAGSVSPLGHIYMLSKSSNLSRVGNCGCQIPFPKWPMKTSNLLLSLPMPAKM